MSAASIAYLRLSTNIAPEEVFFVGPFFTVIRRDSVKVQLDELVKALSADKRLGPLEGMRLTAEVVLEAGNPCFPESDLRQVDKFIRNQYVELYERL